MRRGAGTALIVVALAVSACGSEGSPEEEVTKSLRTWSVGMSGGDGSLACARMTPTAERELADFSRGYKDLTPSADCATNVKRFATRINPAVQRQTRDADVADISIRGQTAVVHLENGGPVEVRMVRVDGRWRVDRAFAKGWRLTGSPRFGLPSG